jgi:hypothetical protein
LPRACGAPSPLGLEKPRGSFLRHNPRSACELSATGFECLAIAPFGVDRSTYDQAGAVTRRCQHGRENRSPGGYAAGASSCRVSQGGWEGRDTERHVWKESRRTSGQAQTGAFAIRRPCRPPPEQGMNARRFRHTAGTRTGAAHKGEGYGSDRSREGPHTSSSGRWPAERGRCRAGAARLARSKGPPAPRDDDGRGQIANFARPRSRPRGLISAEPRAIDRGIPLRTVTEPTRSGLGLAPVRPLPKEKPRRRRGSSSGTNELRGS